MMTGACAETETTVHMRINARKLRASAEWARPPSPFVTCGAKA